MATSERNVFPRPAATGGFHTSAGTRVLICSASLQKPRDNPHSYLKTNRNVHGFTTRRNLA
jgi:hypothetical protein